VFTAASSDILLNTQANDFGSSAIVFGGTKSNIRDVKIENINANAAVPSFTGLTNLRNLTLIFSNAAVALPAITLTNGGSLVVTAGGAISQSGVLTVPGTANFTTGAFTINLSQTNAFSGAVSLQNTGNHTVTLVNGSGLTLGTVNVGGIFNVTSTGALSFGSTTVGGNLVAASNGGAISQTATLNITGTSSFTAGAATIDLSTNGSSNSFGGAVSLSNSGIEYHGHIQLHSRCSNH
jgi:hypothetical protein